MSVNTTHHLSILNPEECPTFDLIIKPQSNDVVSIRNQLVQIRDEDIYVNVVADKVALGDQAGNSNYVFTSSRN